MFWKQNTMRRAAERLGGMLRSATAASGLGETRAAHTMQAVRTGEGRATNAGAAMMSGGGAASGHGLHQLAGLLRPISPLMSPGAHHPILRPALAGCVNHPETHSKVACTPPVCIQRVRVPIRRRFTPPSQPIRRPSQEWVFLSWPR